MSERFQLALTTIEFLRQVEAVNNLMAPQRKGNNARISLPLLQARCQITLQPARGTRVVVESVGPRPAAGHPAAEEAVPARV